MQEIASRPENADVAEAMDILAEADEQFAALGGRWCMAPARVTCEHCGATFATEEP